MDREKLKQVTAKTANEPAEVRPLATETQSDFPDKSQIGTGTEADVDASQAIISQDNTNTIDTGATIPYLDDLAIPGVVDNPASTAVDDPEPAVSDSAGAPSTGVHTTASSFQDPTTSGAKSVKANSERSTRPLRPQVCRVHTDKSLFIWPGCPYGHEMPDGMWCRGDGVLFKFSRPDIRG